MDEAIKLDPEKFGTQEAKSLAILAAAEIEAERSRRAGNRINPLPFGLLSFEPEKPFDAEAWHAHTTPWYDFLTDLDLIGRLSASANMTLIYLLDAIIDLLTPPNWQAFFWMKSYFEATGNSFSESQVVALMQRITKKRDQERARNAGIESGRVRAEKAHSDDPAFIERRAKALIADGVHPRRVASELSKEFQVTADHIRRVRRTKPTSN